MVAQGLGPHGSCVVSPAVTLPVAHRCGACVWACPLQGHDAACSVIQEGAGCAVGVCHAGYAKCVVVIRWLAHLCTSHDALHTSETVTSAPFEALLRDLRDRALWSLLAIGTWAASCVRRVCGCVSMEHRVLWCNSLPCGATCGWVDALRTVQTRHTASVGSWSHTEPTTEPIHSTPAYSCVCSNNALRVCCGLVCLVTVGGTTFGQLFVD